MSLSKKIFCLLCALGLALAARTGRADAFTIESLRFGETGETTRIVVEFNGKPDFRAFLLDNPKRLALDLPAARWKARATGQADAVLVKRWRSGRLAKDGLTRVVFDLTRAAVVHKAFILDKENNARDRLVIDLKPCSQNAFSAATERVWGNRKIKSAAASRVPDTLPPASLKNKNMHGTSSAAARARDRDMEKITVPGDDHDSRTAKASKKAVLAKDTPRPHTIVIDPGHGGQDPGAVSYGIREKDITLRVAKELRRLLEETGRYRVVMTRDDDTYVRLRERLALSRRAEGDLFLSIHADKTPRKTNVRGASVYTLSQTASDNETAALAESENNAGVVAGVDLADKSADVADILLDLAMREKMNESNIFAEAMEQALRRKKIRLLPNSHRSADFAVLKAPDIPAILIETGFLSHPEEAKLLSSGAFQEQIAAAVMEGIDAYFRKMKALQRLR